MKRDELLDLFATQAENDGTLDGKRAGKLRIEADMLIRDSSDGPDDNLVAQWWDANEIAVNVDDPAASPVAHACDRAGVTVKWMRI